MKRTESIKVRDVELENNINQARHRYILTSHSTLDADDGLSGVEIEFSRDDDDESRTQEDDAGEETETGSGQAQPAATVRAPIQSKHGTSLDLIDRLHMDSLSADTATPRPCWPSAALCQPRRLWSPGDTY